MVDAAGAGHRSAQRETAMNHVLRFALSVAALDLFLVPARASAQTFAGPYVGISGGAVLIPDNEGSIGGLGTAIEFDVACSPDARSLPSGCFAIDLGDVP
jgi:hypothetical protein